MSVVYSPCQTWRYLLRRDLGDGAGTLNFVMLNPSTADAVRNDPTVARCVGFARRWGFRRLLVTNLFALRSPLPRALLQAVRAERGRDPRQHEADPQFGDRGGRPDEEGCQGGKVGSRQ